MADEKAYKIIEFRAENFKRLTVVAIKPSGNVIEITGPNGVGKSSILDAIFAAIKGKDAIQAEPIRQGEDRAVIALDLGALKVMRRFTRQDPKEKGTTYTTSLVVESADGARYPSPQAMLDALFGALTFDPLVFKEKKPAEQFDMLRQFVPGVDFVAIDMANEFDYSHRTEVNRKAKDLRAHIDSIVSSMPAQVGERINEDDILSEITDAGDKNSQIAQERQRREFSASSIVRSEKILERNESEIAYMLNQIAKLQEHSEHLEKDIAEHRVLLEKAGPLPEPIDIMKIKQRLSSAQAHNRLADAMDANKTQIANGEKTHSALVVESEALTKRMEERSAAKADAIANAEMPIEGIGFGDNMVLLNGVPFEQASDAEQLRTSVAIAMALNPRLKVIRIRNGSLLDENSMHLLADMAAEKGFQCWVETIQSNRPGAIIIEDGHLANATPDTKPEGAML